ncbi:MULTISPECIES: glycoside hydrolase family 108 protein [Photorhabdus]|uniref:Glycosyl hydrolase 108 n=1 Tax=Photorhabdus luminescens TaxID=29488 RepID=A0A1G5RFZ4_PHOLU|nr:glycosyl hydrolase 108 family protein [Photorhabdus luminescens]SCZ72788.1 Glycosyl hydrolase 108 [Photorhabdus luminescens]
MKIYFPVSRENDGQPYQAADDKSLQAMLAKLRSEPNGAWLIGANGQWHGGIHLSDRASAPYAKLTPDLLQQNKVMPLRCMVEGEVVAYRLNKAYLQAPYFRDEQLKYSSTFALVKSEYKAQDETLLTFYSLYMHLAPVSDYPAYPRYRAIVQHTLNTHRFTANNEEQYGIPSDVTERGERRDYDIPPTNGRLKHGDEFLVYQTADFFMTTIISTRYDKVRFGLAQKLEGGVVKDEKKFWVELDPQFVEQIGEACPHMPVWMQAAVKKGTFDCVQTLTGDEVIKINAGDPIGHLGLFESPAARLPDRMSYYFTHIEVLSADDNLPDFVNNTKHLADGRKYVICGLDQMLHSYDVTHKTFTPLKVRTQQEIVLAKALTSPVKDKNGVNWYKVTQTGWVKQNGELVTEVDQHDLNKLGFRLLEEEATTDFSKLTAEECVKALLRHLLAAAKQDRRIDHALVPARYERILRKLDKDGDGQLNAQEVRLGLYNPEMINVVTRFIVKHSSEWYEDSQGGAWENFFTNVVKNRTANKFWRQYLDDQVWMKAVEPFSSGKPVWHMHPVVFLDALSEYGLCKDKFKKISRIILKHEGGYVNDPDDSGGETNMGITFNTWKAYAMSDLGIEPSSENLKHLTKDQAEIIYYNHYWEPRGFCKIENSKIALMIYDWTITSGKAIKETRKLINSEFYSKLPISNSIDDDMIHSINAIEGQGNFLQRLADVRKRYYESLTYTNGVRNNQIKYLAGWLGRVDDCLKVVI